MEDNGYINVPLTSLQGKSGCIFAKVQQLLQSSASTRRQSNIHIMLLENLQNESAFLLPAATSQVK